MKLALKANLTYGIVPTHIRFVGGLAPDEKGRLPRTETGVIKVVAEMRTIIETSPVTPSAVQIPYFAGIDADDLSEMMSDLKALELEVHYVLMVGGANPMNPDDEDRVLAQLVPALQAAIKHGVPHVASTSIEEWMSTTDPRREGERYQQAIEQNVKVHLRACKEAGVEGSCIQNWHIEFLRPGEFHTFNSIDRGWDVVAAANKALGSKFFKLMVDAAHCGDSGLSIEKNQQILEELAANDELGVFHCSSKTTRGCFSTDDGWIGALLTTAAKTGKLKHVFVEFFDHSDPGLELLRKYDPAHGVNTLEGRTYTELAIDGLVEGARRINNLVNRGILKA